MSLSSEMKHKTHFGDQEEETKKIISLKRRRRINLELYIYIYIHTLLHNVIFCQFVKSTQRDNDPHEFESKFGYKLHHMI